jgi:S-adenosyl methyltransferase
VTCIDIYYSGKDNFAADRELAERVLQVMPTMPLIARVVRLFLIDAVDQLVTVHGIRQFLDIGTGLPRAPPPIPGSSTSTTTRWSSPTPRPC